MVWGAIANGQSRATKTGLIRNSSIGKDNDYGYEAIDGIRVCRRAGLQRYGGRDCG
jgi:hypothetical protein